MQVPVADHVWQQGAELLCCFGVALDEARILSMERGDARKKLKTVMGNADLLTMGAIVA